MVSDAAIASSSAIPLLQRLGTSQLTLGLWSGLALIAICALLPLSSQKYPNQQTSHPSKRNWKLTVFFSLMAGIFYAITTWLAPYVQSIGLVSKNPAYC